MATEEATPRIQLGDYIVIQRQKYTKLQKFGSLDATATLGKETLELKSLLGQPYGSTFKMCTELRSTREVLGISSSGADNRDIRDDGEAQTLKPEDIAQLREECNDSSKIIEKLVENSKTFHNRTEYSQEKYLLKKEKKYFEFVMGIRVDTLSQIISYSGVCGFGNYLLYESGTNGLLPAAMLNSIGAGTEGTLVHMHPGNVPQKQSLLALKLPLEQQQRCVSVNLEFYQGGEALATGLPPVDPSGEEALELLPEAPTEEQPDAIEPITKKPKLEESKSGREGPPRWHLENKRATALMNTGFDSLVLAAKEHPSSILQALLPLVKPSRPVVLFSTCKELLQETYMELKTSGKVTGLHLTSNWLPIVNDAELRKDRLARVKVFVLAGPQDRFTEDEFEVLKHFVEVQGGSLLVLLGEGGEPEFNTNQYGIYINGDNVVRPHYYRNFHPKECIVGGGVVCESMWRHLLKVDIEKVDYDFSDEKYKIHFQYPYGATLNVSEPANVLLTTGGKILALGSGYIWHDKYLQDKTNDAIFEYLLKLLGGDEISYSHLDFNDVELSDNKHFTDLAFLADMPRACLIDSIGTEMPTDFKQMFDMKLCALSNHLLKEVIDAYEQLHVKYEPLRIIKPQFEIPLPSLQLATFPPIFSEPPAPPLELYDLDETFSGARSQLAHMTGQCLQALQSKEPQRRSLNPRELENYVKECARITAIVDERQDMAAREILNIVARQIVSYRPYAED
ncbi:hypothetical protein M5D96_009121 [Drosophila gunungcola]|uniref:tRNA(m1A58)-methyltransferase subunit TRM6 n=1 Tax=Drosophila gunungcola TaxID=103775 RepID=A0A9P9YJD7_9MUSC|nr:hypothetical protein M5D96_009121 [Drosophila gunungcola]